MTTTPEAVEGILAKLAKDVESAVHSMYRSETGAATAKVRTEHLVSDARDRIAAFFKSTAQPRTSGPMPRFSAIVAASSVAEGDAAAAPWSPAEASAVTRCVMGWLPMGSPKTTAPESKCIAAGRELTPTWSERETAREAMRKVGVKEG